MGVVKSLREKYGRDVMPWVFFSATAMLCLVGIVTTVVFGVCGIGAGLAVSVPAILVGIIGVPITGVHLENKGYI